MTRANLARYKPLIFCTCGWRYLLILCGHLPAWDESVVTVQLHQLAGHVTRYLELGRFHELLPPEIQFRTIIQLCDLPLLERLYRAATLVSPAPLRDKLLSLL